MSRSDVKEKRVYLCTYQLHKDNRIRMPKAIETNLGAQAGKTCFDVYMDLNKEEIILRKSSRDVEGDES